MLNLASFNFKPVKGEKLRDLIWSVTMASKKSGTIILQQFSCVVNIIADEHSNQPRVSYSNRLGPRPAMPEPQMHPYRVIKRYGNISRCHGFCEKFDKKKTTMILFRKELDWWPDMYILRGEWKKWRTSKRNFYYCVKLSCLMNRRPTLRRENVTIICNGEDMKHAKEAWSKF